MAEQYLSFVDAFTGLQDSWKSMVEKARHSILPSWQAVFTRVLLTAVYQEQVGSVDVDIAADGRTPPEPLVSSSCT